MRFAAALPARVKDDPGRPFHGGNTMPKLIDRFTGPGPEQYDTVELVADGPRTFAFEREQWRYTFLILSPGVNHFKRTEDERAYPCSVYMLDAMDHATIPLLRERLDRSLNEVYDVITRLVVGSDPRAQAGAFRHNYGTQVLPRLLAEQQPHQNDRVRLCVGWCVERVVRQRLGLTPPPLAVVA